MITNSFLSEYTEMSRGRDSGIYDRKSKKLRRTMAQINEIEKSPGCHWASGREMGHKDVDGDKNIEALFIFPLPPEMGRSRSRSRCASLPTAEPMLWLFNAFGRVAFLDSLADLTSDNHPRNDALSFQDRDVAQLSVAGSFNVLAVFLKRKRNCYELVGHEIGEAWWRFFLASVVLRSFVELWKWDTMYYFEEFFQLCMEN